MNSYRGIVKRKIYHNVDNDYRIFQIRTDDGENIVVKGFFPQIFLGMQMKITGEFRGDPGHERFLSPFRWNVEMPTLRYDIIDFLIDILIWIPSLLKSEDAMAADATILEADEEQLRYIFGLAINRFGNRICYITDDDLADLRDVHKDLDRGRFSLIPIVLVDRIAEMHRSHRISSFLVKADAQLAQYTRHMMLCIEEEYGQRWEVVLEILGNNPFYFISRLEEYGYDFPDADKIRATYNLPIDSYERCEAGIRYGYGKEVFKDGHVYATPEQLRFLANEQLSLDQTVLEQRIGEMIDNQFLIRDQFFKEGIYLHEYYDMECYIASKLVEMNTRNQPNVRVKPDFDVINAKMGIVLDNTQMNAISTAINSPVTIITGGPGTGKTTIVKGILAALAAEGVLSIQLAAPTGKAALRMKETTGLEAQTIHRLLQITPKDPRGYETPVTSSVLVVDEASMIDMDLMYRLVHALASHVQLILVGDENQLPSVGPGYVLHDLIASGGFNVVQLTQTHRQSERSVIVRNAKHVLHGEEIEFSDTKQSDFHFLMKRDREETENAICRLVSDLITKTSLEDIMILSPVKAGAAGTHSLNRRLQDLLNQEEAIFETIDGEIIKTEDKVMITRNNYDAEVFNGEICKHSVVSADTEKHELLLMFSDHRIIEYEEGDLETKWIELAYAITVHKAQGSEYPIVIMPIFHNGNMYRNLIYTAITRAKQGLYLVGSLEALKEGINNDRPVQRNTKLEERIRQLI